MYGKFEDYIDFIKEHSIGLEGSSTWMWYKNESGIWESKGYAADTIEQSLFMLKQYIDNNTGRANNG